MVQTTKSLALRNKQTTAKTERLLTSEAIHRIAMNRYIFNEANTFSSRNTLTFK